MEKSICIFERGLHREKDNEEAEGHEPWAEEGYAEWLINYLFFHMGL